MPAPPPELQNPSYVGGDSLDYWGGIHHIPRGPPTASLIPKPPAVFFVA